MLALAFAVLLAGKSPAQIELTIPAETVPPGGMLQLKVQITEPKPISKGGQKSQFQAQFLGQPRGIALFSPAGDASGTALLSNGSAVLSLSSPSLDMGNSIDYPILTIAMPVKPTAQIGSTAPLVLDPSFSQWFDPAGQTYSVLTKDGSVTVGGTLSIANIVPGGGIVRAGTKIAILGMGFQPNSKVQINEATPATQTYVSANEIDMTLATDFDMTARRVRVTNPSTNEQAVYYSYQRTVATGKSRHALIAATVPLFSEATWPVAYFKPVRSGSQFTGLALQNETGQPVKVRLQLFDSGGNLLKTRNVKVAPNHYLSRDLSELIPGVIAGNGTTLKVTPATPISLLGLLGDDVLGTIDPVNPSPTP